jgi:hypothetical protein
MKNPWSQYWNKIRDRQEGWKRILEVELRKWSEMSFVQIMSRLPDSECYEVEVLAKRYQVEVALLENRERYINVGISVDDGSIPASLWPVSSSFIRNKEAPPSTDGNNRAAGSPL